MALGREWRNIVGAIRDLTDGAGVDLVIEASGSAAALDQALDALAFGGTCVVCSWYGTKPVELRLGGAFHRRRLRIVSSQVSTIDAALAAALDAPTPVGARA